MGISGLLPALRSITDRVHLEELAGQSVAVDAYSWLHKGVYSCAADLFHHRPCRQHLDFCLHRLKQLFHHQIKTVWLVFDGAELPAKRGTERERAEGRVAARRRAEELIAEGRLQEAAKEIHKAIDVTPEMAFELIEAVKRVYGHNNWDNKVRWVVAPYEADAQLAYLEQSGLVSAVLSEDSDLVLFGVKRLCVKLDVKTGYFEQVCSDRLYLCRDLDLKGCTLKRFRQICILSGCDYVTSVPGMGLRTAHRYVLKYGTIERVIQVLRAEGRNVPADYELQVRRAELVFMHQLVWCPQSKTCRHLTPVDENVMLEPGDDTYLGERVEGEVMCMIADGLVHPCTRQPFMSRVECKSTASTTSTSKGTVQSRVTVKRPLSLVRKSTQRTIRDFFK